MSSLTNSSAPAPEIPDYTVSRTLGGGRWANVYLATQTSLSRSVAIKVLMSNDEGFPDRFEREAGVMATVSHPNVVSVFDRGVVNGQHYIVMEYMDGGSLRDRLPSGHAMDMAPARETLSAVAAALCKLHENGIIHRDVKPDNVLFDRSGQIKLCDFGVSVPMGQLGQMTDEDASPGTLDYMAPEQRYRLDVSTQSDQYALAVLAYEMLTGKLPPRVFRPASALNPLLTEDVDRVLERALHEDSESRFPNVAEFARELETSLASSSDHAVATAGSPRMAVAIAAALVVLCGLLIALGPASDDTETESPETTIEESAQSEVPVVVSPPQQDKIPQTGALTFRKNDAGELEVLLVRARSGNHWTLPKANQPADITRSGVAEEEAFEEAGIRGTGRDMVLGHYCYRRKERQYRVSVVPVRMNEELSSWPEEFRERKWATVPHAARMVGSDELRRILNRLSAEELLADDVDTESSKDN